MLLTIRAIEPNDSHLCYFMIISVKVMKVLIFKVLHKTILMLLSISEENNQLT